jgi:molybdopterin-guanine dinucleotide biosynthesis protein B
LRACGKRMLRCINRPATIPLPERNAHERTPLKIFGIAGHSGMGKTTLLERLLPELRARGIVVSLIKHSHKSIQIDQPGKDSHRLREAGCQEVLLLGDGRWALMHELRGAPEPALPALLAKLSEVDLVLVEGFKRESFPKLEIHRAENGKPLLHPDDSWIVAIASDTSLPAATVPVVDLNDIDAIADLLLARAIPVGRLKEHADAL